MKNPPPGKPILGVNPSRYKTNPAKVFAFKKSAGASASASRFGTDEEKPKARGIRKKPAYGMKLPKENVIGARAPRKPRRTTGPDSVLLPKPAVRPTRRPGPTNAGDMPKGSRRTRVGGAPYGLKPRRGR